MLELVIRGIALTVQYLIFHTYPKIQSNRRN